MKAVHWLILLLVASFLARAAYIGAGAPLDWDSAAYAANADYMLGNHYYFEEIRPPVYPMMLVPFALAGIMQWAPAVLGILSLAAAFLLFRELGGEEKALVATAILSLSGLFYSWTTQLAVENALVLVLSLFFLACLRAVKRDDWVIAAFAAGGIAILMRYYFAVAVVLGLGYIYLQKKSFRGWPLGIAVLAVLLVPWAAFNFVQYGDPLHSLTESASVFGGDYVNAKPLGFYLENWWQIVDVATWVLLAAGLAQYKRFSCGEWLIAAWLAAGLAMVLAAGVKEVRYFVPLLPAVAWFAARPLWALDVDPGRRQAYKQLQALAIIVIAISGLSVMNYAASVHAPDPCNHHTGVMLASRGLEGIVLSTHWPITAYYSKQPVLKFWYGKTAGELDADLAVAQWLVFKPNSDPNWTREKLDATPGLEFAGAYGPECSQAFLYQIVKK